MFPTPLVPYFPEMHRFSMMELGVSILDCYVSSAVNEKP